MAIKDTEVTIIGGGLTGLTIAFYLNQAGKKVVLLEKAARCGGVIQTIKKDGFTFEAGPNTGVLSSPELVELFEYLSQYCELDIANPDAKKRLILKDGKWHALPSGPISAITTPLFSASDKIRVLFEPWRAKGTNPDESVADLVRRRLGKSFLNYAVDPFISGVYAGNPEHLITRYALPKLYRLENKFGSFVKGSMKVKKERTERDKKATKEVFAAKKGLQSLITALVDNIGQENIITSAQKIEVQKDKGGFKVTANNETFHSEKVVTTFGGQGLSEVLPFIEPDLLNPILKLRYAKVVQVVLGYKKWDGDSLKAFGGLVPSVENRDILGILFPSSIFEDRAPEEGALLSVFIGGIKKPDMITKTTKELTDMVLKEVEGTLHSKTPPDMIEIFRYENAIPQYEINSGERFDNIAKIEDKYQGLILAGNIRDGIGMSDRVKQGTTIANELIGKF